MQHFQNFIEKPPKPAILLVAADSNCPPSTEMLEQIGKRMQNARAGDVIACPYPVRIYFKIEDWFILAEDLPAINQPLGSPEFANQNSITNEDDDIEED